MAIGFLWLAVAAAFAIADIVEISSGADLRFPPFSLWIAAGMMFFGVFVMLTVDLIDFELSRIHGTRPGRKPALLVKLWRHVRHGPAQ
ncbi:MAG: hypothetical protein ACRED9_11525 [Caulobacteraceae bacterium]